MSHWFKTDKDKLTKDRIKNMNMKTTIKYVASIILVSTLMLTACKQESDVASFNVSAAAHNFEVNRRCIFYNGITNEYILTIEGLLSVTESGTQNRLEVIVKTGPQEYKKHYLGLSDNVTY